MKYSILLLTLITNFYSYGQNNCNCKKYISKSKNRNNSPYFDSANFQGKSKIIAVFRNSYIHFNMLRKDSIDYLVVEIIQSGAFTDFSYIYSGQDFSINFSDSTSYNLKVTDIILHDYRHGSFSNYQKDVFYIPYSDSIDNLLNIKTIKGIWISNQNSPNKIKDRYFYALTNRQSLINLISCFKQRKKLTFK